MRQHLILVILISIFFLQSNTKQQLKVEQSASIGDNSNILPGMGFSTDTQQVASTACYKPTSTTRGNQSSTLRFDQSSDYTSILNTFDIKAEIKGGYALFGGNAEGKYFKSIQDDAYSYSISYYQRVVQTVSFSYSYNPDLILNEEGKNIYKDGSNPMFRLFCGDYLVRSYNEGAGLIFSYKLIFKSREEKEKFGAGIGANYGGFIGASTNIEKTANTLQTRGRVQITAFQFGGDPTQLSRMLSSSVINCDLQHQDDCKKTAVAMIDYASKTFPDQFDKDNKGIWTTHLVAMRGVVRDFLVSDFQLKLAPTFVTGELINARLDMVRRFLAINYYNACLNLFKSNYISTLPGTFDDLIRRSDSNISVLKAGGDMFMFPNRGMEIYKEILSKADQKLEDEVVSLMSQFQNLINYTISHNKNDCPENKINNSFDALLFPIGNNKAMIFLNADKMEFSNVNSITFSNFSFSVRYKHIIHHYSNNYLIEANFNSNQYTGTQSCDGQKLKITGKLILNPYFFNKFEA